jgi:hypothetical protein
VASIPVGADVLFLLDERGEIVDVTFGNVEAVIHSLALGQRKSPLKGNLSQVDGVIATGLLQNSIMIRLVTGHEQAYEARPSIQARLGTLVKGRCGDPVGRCRQQSDRRGVRATRAAIVRKRQCNYRSGGAQGLDKCGPWMICFRMKARRGGKRREIQ